MLCNCLNVCKLFYILVFCLQIQEYDFQDISRGELYPAVILRSSARNTVCVCVQDADNWKIPANTKPGGHSSPHNQVPNLTCSYCYCLSVCVCVCVCFSVCDHIFRTTCPIFTKFFVHVTPRGIVISYVLQVLLMTSYFLISQGCLTSPASWCSLHTQPWACL